MSRNVFVLKEIDAMVRGVARGRLCEMDEALFIHLVESAAQAEMDCVVTLANGLTVRVDLVRRLQDLPVAAWIFRDGPDPSMRRYFVQRLSAGSAALLARSTGRGTPSAPSVD